MTIPDYAYTQTVAKQPMSTAEGPGAWVMFINVKSDITVYKQAALDGQVTIIPEADYTVTIVAASPWEFTWTYSGPVADKPLPADSIIIFRRVHAIFNDFQPGAFLNADSLNRAFNIETLANNDQGYYQQFSRPGYDDKTLVERGVFDPPASPGEEEHNPKLAESNYELPYLASSPTATAGDVYVWGYYVDAGPAGPNPRTGEFRDILLHQSGGGTVGQLTQELAAQCPTPGTNIIGVCQTNIAAAGWAPPPNMTLSAYLGNLYHRSNTTAENGANLIGFRWSAGVYQGPESVQVAIDRLHFIGTAPNYTTTSGAAAIGYGGWALPGGVPGNTAAACLSRLNDPATSVADAGATHVKFWDTHPTVPVSKSVQEGLNELWQAFDNSVVPINSTLTFTVTSNPQVFSLPAPAAPADEFANLNRIHVRSSDGIGNSWNTDLFVAGTTTLSWSLYRFVGYELLLERTAAPIPVWTIRYVAGGGGLNNPLSVIVSFFLLPSVTP